MNRLNLIVLAVAACGFFAVSAAAQTNVVGPSPVVAEAGTTPGNVGYVDDGFSPMLGLFAMVMIIMLLMLVGAGAVFALAAICIAGCLAGLGILTTSTLVGIVSRRPRSAVKAFFLQLGGGLGLLSGAGLALLASWLCKIPDSPWPIVMAGALGGLVGGVLLAILFNLAWEKVLAILVKRFGGSSGLAAAKTEDS